MSKIDHFPSEYAPYRFPDNLPISIRDRSLGYLAEVSSVLRDKASDLSTILEVLSLPYGRGWRYRTAEDGVRLVVYGTFRSEYRAILTLADVLADFYAATLFLPVIFPIPQVKWRRYGEAYPIIRDVAQQGVLILSKTQEK